jgi:hypothetical protein
VGVKTMSETKYRYEEHADTSKKILEEVLNLSKNLNNFMTAKNGIAN